MVVAVAVTIAIVAIVAFWRLPCRCSVNAWIVVVGAATAAVVVARVCASASARGIVGARTLGFVFNVYCSLSSCACAFFCCSTRLHFLPLSLPTASDAGGNVHPQTPGIRKASCWARSVAGRLVSKRGHWRSLVGGASTTLRSIAHLFFVCSILTAACYAWIGSNPRLELVFVGSDWARRCGGAARRLLPGV